MTIEILAVEDEQSHLMALESIFEAEEGFNLHPARDTDEACALLEKTGVDVIILDLALPGENGFEFCRRIKNDPDLRHIPVIALSAFPRDYYEEKALEAGCVEFVEKPFDHHELVEKVRSHAGSS